MSPVVPSIDFENEGILHIPWEGAFMAFSIDPAATLRYYCQGGDSVAKKLAQDLACKQYTGYCVQVRRDTIKQQCTYVEAVECRITRS